LIFLYLGGCVTEGFALGFGWLEFGILIGTLCFFLLRERR
jgi:hypothetical protein